MSEGLNRATLLGNLGQDPDYRDGANPVLKLRMATTERYVDASKQQRERTEWHTVTVFGKRATGLSRILTKGDRLLVEGSIRHSEYQGKDGTVKHRTEVIAHNVVLCGGGKGAQKTSQVPAPAYDDSLPSRKEDDDVPF